VGRTAPKKKKQIRSQRKSPLEDSALLGNKVTTWRKGRRTELRGKQQRDLHKKSGGRVEKGRNPRRRKVCVLWEGVLGIGETT